MFFSNTVVTCRLNLQRKLSRNRATDRLVLSYQISKQYRGADNPPISHVNIPLPAPKHTHKHITMQFIEILRNECKYIHHLKREHLFLKSL